MKDNSEAIVLEAINRMKSRSVVFEPGLTDLEIENIEQRFGFRFPPDLRVLLQSALPVGIASKDKGGTFPNWREDNVEQLEARLNWPWEGMVFDIENNAFWLDEWGTKPKNIKDAIEIARSEVKKAPTLVPLYSHRYLPERPFEAGNPVFSVYQTDIIYYGQNLWDYLVQEFGKHEERWYAGENDSDFSRDECDSFYKQIPFWSDLVY